MVIEISALNGSADNWEGDAVILMASEGGHGDIAPMPYKRYVEVLIERKDFDSKKGALVKIPLVGENAKSLYLAGLGKADKYTTDALRDTLTAALRKAGREHAESVLVISDKTDADAAVILGEAAELSGYVFDKYKSKDAQNGDEGKDEGKDADKDEGKFSLKKIFVPNLDEEKTEKIVLGRVFGNAQCYARDLANEPGNVINPVTLAETAEHFAKEHGLTCEVWDEKKLKAENMAGMLAVGSGSATPPRMIHLTYKPEAEAAKKIFFLGKGLTFDSGGLDIKPPEFMRTMKGDKSGACNVLGIMKGVAALKPNIEVHGFIGAVENMPSGSAFRPDDIIKARNGKTIEIDNTDAEGRLVLADILVYACEMKPDAIIDMATLTGACAVALGSWTSGLFTANEALCDALQKSAKNRGERLWRLPMDDEKIGESLKSKFADLVNCGSRYGGATFAAMFMAEFVEKDIPWAHIDMAGHSFMKDESGVYTNGASAWGVRTCLDYLVSLSA